MDRASANKNSLKISNIGKATLFLGIFLLFSAQNTGNNLLYLMSSIFATFILFSFTIAKYNFTSIQIKVSTSQTCLAGEELRVNCHIKSLANRSRYSISFEDCFVRRLPAGSEVTLTTKIITNDRGKYILGALNVYSFYPFGLFSANIELLDETCWVGPKPFSTNTSFLQSGQRNMFHQLNMGHEGDFWMLRQYTEGEDASKINWKLSAGSTKEWVVIRSIPSSFAERIRFDLYGIDETIFEDSLMVISAWLIKEIKADSKAFIWSSNIKGGYSWHSVTEEYRSIIRWLAELSPSTKIPPANINCTECNVDTILGTNR